MICKKCGHEAVGRFCSNCGESLVYTEDNEENAGYTEGEQELFDDRDEPIYEQAEYGKEDYEDGRAYENFDYGEGYEEQAYESVGYAGNTQDQIYESAGYAGDNQSQIYEGAGYADSDYSGRVQNGRRVKRNIQKQSPRRKNNNPGTKTVYKKKSDFSFLINLAGTGFGLALRLGSALLMAGITSTLFAALWRKQSIFGNISTVIQDRNYAMAFYLGLSAVLIGYGCLSVLWILTSRKSVERRGLTGGRRRKIKYDSGRGFMSFVLFAIIAVSAEFLIVYLPQTPAVWNGAREVLLVFIQGKSLLTMLCIAGAVCCLVRKIGGWGAR